MWMPLLLALVAGVLLRVLLIGSKSLWLDEAVIAYRYDRRSPALLAGASEGYHPPLYYAFLHFWIQLGQTEAVLRLPSALFGVLTIPLIYLLARDLGGIGVALSTAWLVALSPLLVWYSQEFRSYSLLVALAVLSTLALVRLLWRPHVGWWALYVAATLTGILHYDAVLDADGAAALGWSSFAQRRLRIRRACMVAPSVAAHHCLYWPWLSSPPAHSFFVCHRAGGVPRHIARSLTRHFAANRVLSDRRGPGGRSDPGDLDHCPPPGAVLHLVSVWRERWRVALFVVFVLLR